MSTKTRLRLTCRGMVLLEAPAQAQDLQRGEVHRTLHLLETLLPSPQAIQGVPGLVRERLSAVELADCRRRRHRHRRRTQAWELRPLKPRRAAMQTQTEKMMTTMTTTSIQTP